MKHETTFKKQADKSEPIKCAMSRYDKQASYLKVITTAKNQGTQASYCNALCIAKHGKLFTDGKFIKEAVFFNNYYHYH